jgi:HAD superfamily hydrolase (TIGR01509 family)
MPKTEIVERFVGRTEAAMRAEIEEHVGRDVGIEWAAFAERYTAAFAAELEPVRGISAAVDAIQASGVATCVASSGDDAKIRRNLAKTGLLDRFEGRIFSGDDVIHSKPAPDLFLHAAASMGVAPGRCAVVEDSRHGVKAARSAGMWAFGYAGGVTPGTALEGERTTVFEDMADLARLLASTNLAERGPSEKAE